MIPFADKPVRRKTKEAPVPAVLVRRWFVVCRKCQFLADVALPVNVAPARGACLCGSALAFFCGKPTMGTVNVSEFPQLAVATLKQKRRRIETRKPLPVRQSTIHEYI